MTTEIATTDPERTRKLALLRAVGLDRLAPEQRELALNIAQRYDLDLLLKHLVMIEGRAYITRDGLLHIAHRSGQLDGITTTEPVIIDDFWRATCSVFRKDMTHPFTYVGRYPTKGGNAKFAPEMAVKVAEVMSLRRAFDVAAPTAEERWDLDNAPEPPAPAPTLAERVQERAAAVRVSDGDDTHTDVSESDSAATAATPGETAPSGSGSSPAPSEAHCGAPDPFAEPGTSGTCAELPGHPGPHRNETGVWPQKPETKA